MNKMKKMLCVVLCIVLSFAVCGCENKFELPKKSEEPAELKDEPKYGGELKIYSYPPDTLNPLYSQNSANLQMLKILFEPLVEPDTQGKAQLVLADSYTVSPDGLQYTFNIKENVVFHDGTPLTPADVVFSLNSAKNPAFASTYTQNLTFVKNIKEVAGQVVITLSYPNANFVNLLNVPIIKASNKAIFQDFSPMGTGPYKYVSNENKIITLTRNDNWWGEKPYMDTISVRLFPDKNTKTFAYDAQEIDVVSAEIEDLNKYLASDDTKIHNFVSDNLNFLKFNVNKKVFADKEIRKIIAMSISKEKIVNNNLLTYAVEAESFVPPGNWLYSKEILPIEYDPKLANEMLKKKGYANGKFSVEILVNDSRPLQVGVGESIVKSLNTAGFHAFLRIEKFESYVDLINKGKYDIALCRMSQTADFYPQNVLTVAGDAYNFDNEYKVICDQVNMQVNDGEKATKYAELQHKLGEELPFIPLYFNKEFMLCNKRIKGEITPTPYNIFYNINKWHL